MRFIREDEAGPCDVVFLCTPSRESMTKAPHYLGRGAKVIDIGSDFRLKDRALFEQVYKAEHVCWDLVGEAPYGAIELHRDEIRRARLVANPGCFAYTAILALAPLAKERLVELDKLVVDGLSGSSGAGAEPSVPTHHSEIGNSAFPYNVVDHRHTYEVEQELSGVAGAPVTVHFTPYYCPFTRGILAGCHGFLTRRISRADLLDLYQAYRGEVVRCGVGEGPRSWQYRRIRASTLRSNFVEMACRVSARSITWKGGASAIQLNRRRLAETPHLGWAASMNHRRAVELTCLRTPANGRLEGHDPNSRWRGDDITGPSPSFAERSRGGIGGAIDGVGDRSWR